MRLFIAVTLGVEVEAAATAGLERLRALAPRARWVPPANLHLTLSFLGDVDEERAVRVREALEAVGPRHAPLVLSIQGGGGFGAPEHPRVLWAGVGGDTAALGALQADVAERLRPLGFEPEHREYVAHLTLARARQPRGDRELAGCVQALRDEHWGEARVERLVLFESLSGRYLAHATVALA
uniref:RNA 2',3'-cyclic phosphodiesterase n=1 Tax=Melittangium lichenicola TaxID=45 RepID=A0A3Q8I346_9BACT|nr:2'-5' RNA ligase [Melittangium lichenicola]